jgi:hypothetical protein
MEGEVKKYAVAEFNADGLGNVVARLPTGGLSVRLSHTVTNLLLLAILHELRKLNGER